MTRSGLYASLPSPLDGRSVRLSADFRRNDGSYAKPSRRGSALAMQEHLAAVYHDHLPANHLGIWRA